MISFADTFELPTPVQVGGQTLHVPSPKIDDWGPWLIEVTDAWRKTETALIPPCVPNEKMKHLRRIALTEASPDDLKPLVFRPAGMKRVIKLALARIGKGDDEAQALIDDLSTVEAQQFAVRVSGLFTAEELAGLYGAPKAPTAEAATAVQSDSPFEPAQSPAPGG